MASDTPIDIFISYSRTNKFFVDNLFRRLTAEGFRPWMDVQKIDPGVNWRIRLQDALDHSQYMLVVVSASAILSRNVRMEYLYAQQQGKPVVLINLDSSILPEELTLCPSISMRRQIVTEIAYQQLLLLLPRPLYEPLAEQIKTAPTASLFPFIPHRSERFYKIYQAVYENPTHPQRRYIFSQRRWASISFSIYKRLINLAEFSWRVVVIISFFLFYRSFADELTQVVPLLMAPRFVILLALLNGFLSAFWGVIAAFIFVPYQNLSDFNVVVRHIFYSALGGFVLGYWIPILLNRLFQLFSKWDLIHFSPFIVQHPALLPSIFGIVLPVIGIVRSNMLKLATIRWFIQGMRGETYGS